MKLQYHKIRGVEKAICTAEQKIAYNIAWRIYGDARIPNTYDSGSHFENIPVKERRLKIDF